MELVFRDCLACRHGKPPVLAIGMAEAVCGLKWLKHIKGWERLYTLWNLQNSTWGCARCFYIDGCGLFICTWNMNPWCGVWGVILDPGFLMWCKSWQSVAIREDFLKSMGMHTKQNLSPESEGSIPEHGCGGWVRWVPKNEVLGVNGGLVVDPCQRVEWLGRRPGFPGVWRGCNARDISGFLIILFSKISTVWFVTLSPSWTACFECFSARGRYEGQWLGAVVQMDGTVRASASKAKFRESDRPDPVHGLNCKRAARFVLLRDDTSI